jgi:hypothetical protein
MQATPNGDTTPTTVQPPDGTTLRVFDAGIALLAALHDFGGCFVVSDAGRAKQGQRSHHWKPTVDAKTGGSFTVSSFDLTI